MVAKRYQTKPTYDGQTEQEAVLQQVSPVARGFHNCLSYHRT